MSAARYSRPRTLLHWDSALVILWATVTGFATALMLATGVLMMERPIDLFGMAALPLPFAEPVLIEFLNSDHRLFGMVLALLVAGHIGAAVFHPLRVHAVLDRMKP